MRTRFLYAILFLSINILMVAQIYNITDYGAVNDGVTVNTLAIQKTIDVCASKGGGTVYVPSGIFITGTINLKSNVNFYLERGSVIKGSSNLKDYNPYQREGFDAVNYGIFYTHKAENVSITGTGAINGNEEVFFEWDKAKKIEWGGLQGTRQKENYRKVESGVGDGPVVPKDRPRQMVIFSECKNVLVRDIQLTKSPFWTLHFADCDGVVASGLKIWSSLLVPNNDGIDVTSCTNVTISDCDIRTGDDGIAITGYAFHYELPGYHNIRHLSENINVTNCNIQSKSSGIRIGWEDQNSLKNIHVSNVNITNSNRGIGIFLRDEGAIENVTFSNICIETRLHTGDWWGNGEPIHISAVGGSNKTVLAKINYITFRDITCKGESGIIVYGSEESIINNIRFENIGFELTGSKLNTVAGGNIDLRGALNNQLFASNIPAFYARFVDGFVVNDFHFTWTNITEDYFINGVWINNFRNVSLNNIVGTSSPSNPNMPLVLLENGKNFSSNLAPEFLLKKNIDE